MRPMASKRDRVEELLQGQGVSDKSIIAEIVDAVPNDADLGYGADYISLQSLSLLISETSRRVDATIDASAAKVRREIAEAFQKHQSENASEFKTVNESIHALAAKTSSDMAALEQRMHDALQEQSEQVAADIKASEQRVGAALREQSDRISEALRIQSEQNAEALRRQSEEVKEALRMQSEQNAEALRVQSERNSAEIRDMIKKASDNQATLQWRVIGAILGGAGIIATVVGVVLAAT